MHSLKSTEPEYILDLHGLNTMECKDVLDDLCTHRDVRHVRLIVGKGLNSVQGPVLPYFVKSYCNERGIRFEELVDGAIDVFFKTV
jgi:DNA-nicking Smr family endonuclease